MHKKIQQYATETLQALDRSEPDWAAAADRWLELSLASKGTAIEAVLDFLGTALQMRDADALRTGLERLSLGD